MTEFLTNKEDIKEWLDLHGFDVAVCTINDDFTVDVDGGICLSENSVNLNLTSLPIKFNYVKRMFHADNLNLLNTFESFPSKCDGYISFEHTNITSLEDISDVIKKMDGGLFLREDKIISGGIGVLLIDGCKRILSRPNNIGWHTIINDFIGEDDIYGCQTALIDAGYELHARF